jgi:hypothetical protein
VPTVADVRVGCADLPPRTTPARYFESLGLLESTLLARGEVTPQALKRWRATAPAGGLAVVAPTPVCDGRLVASPARMTAIERFADQARELAASAVVFRTDADLAPGTVGRDAVREFFAAQATQARFRGMTRVWLPGGLWELSTLAKFADGLVDVAVAFDPLAEDPGIDRSLAIATLLGRGTAYLRVAGHGRKRGRVRPDELETLAALAGAIDRCFVVFATPDAWKTARAFAGQLSSEDDASDEE